MSEASIDPAVVRPLDLSEKGRRGREVISLDRRLFMKFTAFTKVDDAAAACQAIEKSGLVAAVYADANDPYGIGVMVASEDPATFVDTLREVFQAEVKRLQKIAKIKRYNADGSPMPVPGRKGAIEVGPALKRGKTQ